METNDISCPKCGHQISVDQVIISRVKEQIRKQVQQENQADVEKITKELENKFALEQAKSLQIAKLELEEKNKKLDEYRKAELDLRKQKSELEEKTKEMELAVQRRIDEEKLELQKKLLEEYEQKNRFKILEYEKQLSDTRKQLSEAIRKAEQGSMQTQGEVLELSLEEALKHNFLHDIVEPVPKGVNGADIIQHVLTNFGQEVGIIAWESKQTKNWTEDWVQKLKDDGRSIKADIMVLVSDVLPKDIKNFGLYNGIWVTNFSSFLGLTHALRNQLLAVGQVLASQTNKDDKKEVLYNYLCSQSFVSKVQAMMETFMNLKMDMEREKNAFKKLWAQRETHLERLMDNTSSMFGEIRGIAGNQIPQIDILEIDGLLEEPKIDKKTKKIDDSQGNLFNAK